MTDSIKRRVSHLRDLVGTHGRVDLVSPGKSNQRFVVKCRICRDENEGGGTKRLRLVTEEPLLRSAYLAWLTHEATTEHGLNVDRLAGEVRRR